MFGGLKMNKITPEIFNKRLRESGAHFELIGEFLGMRKSTDFKCTKCGEIIRRMPTWIIDGALCPSCEAAPKEGNKMTKEEFLEKLKIKNPTFKLVGEFIDATTPTEFYHETCGSTVTLVPRTVLSSNDRCEFCQGIEIRKEFESEIEKHGFKCLEYNGYKKLALLKHEHCGREFYSVPKNFVKTFRCPTCNPYNYKFTDREKFVKEMRKHTDKFSLIGDFNGMKVLAEFKCNKCGNVFSALPKNVIDGEYICTKCKSQSTEEDFIQELEKHWPGKFEVLEYNGIGTFGMSKFRCLSCGSVFKAFPKNILKSGHCKICGDRHKITTKEFKDKVLDIWGDEYTVLGELENMSTSIWVRHNKCGHEWMVSPQNLLNHHGCPICANNVTKTTEEFKQSVFDLVGDEYEVVGEYVNSKDKIHFIHKKCKSNGGKDFDFDMTPKDFLSGQRCPKCGGTMRKTQNEFEGIIRNLVGDEYTVIGKYESMHTKITIRHNKCGTEYMVRPDMFVHRGNRCPVCNESHGEIAVRTLLTDMHIVFEAQYKIPDCKNIKPLPFDFAILDVSNSLVALIEYDGIQHYNAVERWGGEENLKMIQENDRIKTEYCKTNNIPLLRVPYWDFDDIENIVRKFVIDLSKK